MLNFQPFSEMAYDLRSMGEMAELWESAYFEESAQLCLTLYRPT